MPTTDSPNRSLLERPPWLPDSVWPFTLGRYDHQRPGREAIPIHYTDEGSGPTLVFVHAGMWSFIWRDAVAALRDRFRCITLDFPGSGLSGGQPDDVDLATYPDIVNGLLDHLAVGPAAFVVHDLGGAVGVVAAARRGRPVVGLAATNSFAWPADRKTLKTMLKVIGSGPLTATLGSLRVVPRASRSKSGVGRHYEQADRDAFFGPYRNRSYSRNFHRAMGSAGRSTDLFSEAETALQTTLTQVPLLTIFGENNDQFHFADRWHELFPTAEHWVVPGGNHFPMCDDPSGYSERIARWHEGLTDRQMGSPEAVSALLE